MKTTMTKIFLFALTATLSSLFVGCAGSNSGGSTTAQGACPAGYYIYGNQCYAVNGQGIVNPNYGYTNGFYSDNYSNTSNLRFVNGSKMKEFFKLGMGVCDRAASNYGLASCDSYVSGYMDAIIQFPNAGQNTLLATFIARPRYNPYGNYSAQLPSGWGMLGVALGLATGVYLPDPKTYTGAMRNPLQLEMTVSAINNSAGFEARGYGDYWTGMNRTLLAIQVPQGKVEDVRFNFNFLVQNQVAAQGIMTKCRTLNCGL